MSKRKEVKKDSIDNYSDSEDEKYNKLFDEYVKRTSDIPKA